LPTPRSLKTPGDAATVTERTPAVVGRSERSRFADEPPRRTRGRPGDLEPHEPHRTDPYPHRAVDL